MTYIVAGGLLSAMSPLPAAGAATTTPAAPTDLTATAVSAYRINLSWTDNADNEENYYVERVTGYDWGLIATLGPNATNFSDNSLDGAYTQYFYRVRGSNSLGYSEYSNDAEASTLAPSPRVTGTVIGNLAQAYKVFDGSISTYTDQAGSGLWAGLDFGPDGARIITQIRFHPRNDCCQDRMNGGKFQGSTTADFSSGVVDLYTIPATPLTAWTNINSIGSVDGFRYVRYLSPITGNGSVAEVEFYGDFVTPDAVPPVVSSLVAGVNLSTITINFNEPLDTVSASALTSYTLDGGLNLNGVTFDPFTPTKVVLQTTSQTPGMSYTVLISGVTDLSGNPIVTVTKSFTVAGVQAGFLVEEIYTEIGGNQTANLTSSQKYINGTPDEVRVMYSSEVPPNFPHNATGIGSRMYGFVIPPADGAYTFYVCGYDGVELYLSTDADPVNKVMIATDTDESGVQGTTGVYEWTKYPTQKSAPQLLMGGGRYYIEALHAQGAGQENFAVGWTKPSDLSTTIKVIPGMYLAGYVDTNFPASLAITLQPTNATVQQSKQATFTVAATGLSAFGTNVGFQWQRDGVNIEGAGGASYVTPFAVIGDNGAKFTCVVMVPGRRVTSAEATLTVVAPEAPFTTVLATRLSYPDSSKVTVLFSRPLLDMTTPGSLNVTSTNQANYALDQGVVISSAEMWDDRIVILTTSLMEAGQTYTLTVNNVTDLAGNPLAANTQITLQEPLPPRIQDENGLVAIEVERYDRNLARKSIVSGSLVSSYWTNSTEYTNTSLVDTNFSGDCGMRVLPDAGKNAGSATNISPRMDYQVNFLQVGTVYFRLRGLAPSQSGSDDSVIVGLDDQMARNSGGTSGVAMDGFGGAPARYVWGRINQIDIATPGLHVVSVWMREDGLVADKLMLSMNSASLSALSSSNLGVEDTRLGPLFASISQPDQDRNATISFKTYLGYQYKVQFTESLAPTDWQESGEPLLDGTGAPMSVLVSTVGPSPRFYRVVQQKNVAP